MFSLCPKMIIIMNKIGTFAVVLLFILTSCSTNNTSSIAEFKSGHFQISMNNKGALTALTDIKTGENYLSMDTSSYILSIRVNKEVRLPQSVRMKENVIILSFIDHIEARVNVEEKKSHLVFELLSITNKDTVDLILWGPYYTTIKKTIGETIGVVRGERFAIGIQSLNIKTLGGYPWNESDRMPAFDIFREEDQNNRQPNADGSVLYRVEAAKPTQSGSSLQAYCRNRDKPRIISDFNHEKIQVPAHNDGGVAGTKIALFGCSKEHCLKTIGDIEIAEGLPHPEIDGEWVKTSPHAAAAYLITSFTEENVDQAINLTRRAGLKYLYHYGKTFENWGHFDLYKGEFPNGINGLKECVDKAAAEGVNMGTHCLSNFITTNDPYVSPIPDKRLAKVGSSVLDGDIDAGSTEIEIRSPEFFNQMKNNNLKTVMIGEELIRYGSVSEQSPWKLLDCQRGAFNTKPSPHKKGEEISKLLDHSYKVFLTNAELTVEMSETLAGLYNETGLRQISFDGLEGNRSTGLGTYGESLMPYTWYNALSGEIKNHLIIDASRTTHFFWHIYTRMNWGEPWYAGFRESQTAYRFNNQAYFRRNFMPAMLGWFKMTPETSIEDMEWMLAKSAAWDAGYALVATMETIEKNGNSDKILELIGDWEKLRISGSFSEDQKEQMRDNTREFSLERINDTEWKWREVYSAVFIHKKKEKQPGEPLFSSFSFNNPADDQLPGFVLTAVDCNAGSLSLEINNFRKISLQQTMKEGQILSYKGGSVLTMYDSEWQIIREIEIDPSGLKVNSGENIINLNCIFDKAGKDAGLKLEVRTKARDEIVVLRPK
jgi:hypothetical protein